jgi:two-component system, sensor histidine kinase and response regulator
MNGSRIVLCNGRSRPATQARADEIYSEALFRSHQRIDRMFARLMIVQWVAAILATLLISPYTWIGTQWDVHLHVWLAVVLGCVITSLPVFMAVRYAGQPLTRYVVAIAQVSFSCLLIHVTGGRIETHFHIFGSLAFLAAYRDWRLLICASGFVAVDHFARGVFWPQSVFGVISASSWRWVEHSLWIVFEDVFLVIGCISGRREMRELAWQNSEIESSHEAIKEQASQVALEQLARDALIAQAPTVIVSMDLAGRVTGWNHRGESTFGWSADEAKGVSCGALLIPKKLLGSVHDCFAWISQHRAPVLNQRLTTSLWNRAGEAIAAEVTFIEITTSNERQYCAFIDDVSVRRKYEVGLESARKAAEDNSQAKTRFLMNMSHELRTPLTAILGFTHILRVEDDGAREDREELLDGIESSGNNLLDLLNDLFDLTEIESGQIAIVRDQCYPDAIIKEVVAGFATQAKSKQLTLATRWRSQSPTSIRTDPLRLTQILNNLVSNAVKFTKSGSVEVEAWIEQTDDAQSYLNLAVKDTGPGIPADCLERIFQPFEQIDGSLTRRHGGTGLGLAVSRRLAHELNGNLLVESRASYGSVFTLRIEADNVLFPQDQVTPAVTASTSDQETSRTRPASGKPDLTGFRVLLCEDKFENSRLIEFLVKSSGGEIVVAVNGREGVTQALEQKFDIILMDMQMPVMDGYTATHQLRREGCDIPIVAVTAHAMNGAKEKSLNAGCTHFVTKPFNPRELMRLLKDLIEDHANAASI